jgi:hypothetical protein
MGLGRFIVGDVYFNSKTGKKSIVTEIREDQVCFQRADNPKRKYPLTEFQLTNYVRSDEDCPPNFKTLPELPGFLK